MCRLFGWKARAYFHTRFVAWCSGRQEQRLLKRYAAAFFGAGVGSSICAKKAVTHRFLGCGIFCEESDGLKADIGPSHSLTEAFDCVSNLQTWLRGRGGFWRTNLSIQKCAGSGRGLVNESADAIPAGTVLLIVPWNSILTEDIAKEDPKVLKCVGSSNLRSMSLGIRLWLAFHVLDNQSVWNAWLFALPSDCSAGAPSLPTTFKEEVLERLRGTALFWDVRRVCRQLLDEWHTLCSERTLFQAEVNWPRWQWAHSIVSTRSSTLNLEDGQGSLQCIIPIVDFVNHSSFPNAQVVGSDVGAKLISLRNIGAGEEIQISYGAHNAEQFLFAFGFLPLEAPIDVIVAPLPPARSKEIEDIRKRLFGDRQPALLSAQPGGFRNLLLAFESERKDTTPIDKLHRFLRFLQAWEREVQGKSNKWYNGLFQSMGTTEQVSRNEDVEKIRTRHEAIIHASIVEVEMEIQWLNKSETRSVQ